VINIFKIIVI